MAEYAKSYESLAIIWRILAEKASRNQPMSIDDIDRELERMRGSQMVDEAEHIPSAKTAARIMENGQTVLEKLFPGFRIKAEGEDPGILRTYGIDESIHLVLEDRAGRQLANGPMLMVAAPEAGKLPSKYTVAGMLKTVGEYFEKEKNVKGLPVRLKCVVAQKKGGGIVYLPYRAEQDKWEDKWEKEREKKKKENKEDDQDKKTGDRSKNNHARRYYLESVLDQSQWQILTDLIKVYPYIGEDETAAMLSALEEVFPGCSKEDIGARYAFKQENKALFENLRLLDLAIRQHRKVSLQYGVWNLAQQGAKGWRPFLRPMVTSRMSEEERKNERMIFEPYALMWSNGYYYLVGRHQDYMSLRVDRIKNVTLFPQSADFSFEIPRDFDPVSYRDRSPVMHPGKPELIQMRCRVSLVSVIMDLFGERAEYSAPEDGWTRVTVHVAPKGVKLFAMEYADGVEVLEPESLREEVRASLTAALETYGGK